MTSLKTFLWQTSNYFRMLKGHIFWGLHLLMSEILDNRAVALEKKKHSCKDFFQIFEILEHHVLSERSQNVCVVQSGSKL